MIEKQIYFAEKKNVFHKAETETRNQESHSPGNVKDTLTTFQQQIGNRAVQRLLEQRSGDSPTSASLSAGSELDDNTAARINRERGGGQALDSHIQARMSEATGQDFSNVKVHTGIEAHALNEQLSAKAFTTGSDIFFREGAYNPGSSGGQELLAHELTHVVQQRSGMVGGGSGKMTVNAPGDVFEQQADSVAKAVTAPTAGPAVQRQMPEDEDKELQAKALQRQALPEEEKEDETVQRQTVDEEDEKQNA